MHGKRMPRPAAVASGLAQYTSMFDTTASEARTANPNVKVSSEIATDDGTAAQMLIAAESISSDGYYVAAAGNVPRALQFFQLMKTAGFSMATYRAITRSDNGTLGGRVSTGPRPAPDAGGARHPGKRVFDLAVLILVAFPALALGAVCWTLAILLTDGSPFSSVRCAPAAAASPSPYSTCGR